MLYAIVSSIRSLTLDGIILRSFAETMEAKPASLLSESLMEALEEELLLSVETHQLGALNISKGSKGTDETSTKEKKPRKVRFQMFHGITIAESLAFGLHRVTEKAHLLDKAG